MIEIRMKNHLLVNDNQLQYYKSVIPKKSYKSDNVIECTFSVGDTTQVVPN